MHDSIDLPHHHGEGHETAHLQEQVNQVGNFQVVADIFKQLCDTTRIRIFWLLCHCEECVINISAMLDMSSPAVSHHLRPLKNSGLIVSRREGKEVYYRAADTPQSRLLHEMIEQVMEISCPRQEPPPAPQSEQLAIVQEIHDRLIQDMGTRMTIEELSREYLVNPTTLKASFKEVYGTSIAAHIKEHRMKKAAELLRYSGKSVAEIAQAVGYDSPSKFTAAFKAHYHVLPKDYKKKF